KHGGASDEVAPGPVSHRILRQVSAMDGRACRRRRTGGPGPPPVRRCSDYREITPYRANGLSRPGHGGAWVAGWAAARKGGFAADAVALSVTWGRRRARGPANAVDPRDPHRPGSTWLSRR